MDYVEALTTAKRNRELRNFPRRTDTRCRHDALFPAFRPKFPIVFDAGTKIFTIGSCFARHIEVLLQERHVNLPTLRFAVPQSEWPNMPNGLLNEYTPGTISQRIRHALSGTRYDPRSIVGSDEAAADLLLPGGSDVERARALERRGEILEIYRDLATSQVAIVTLGYVESWFDRLTGEWLNRLPPRLAADAEPGRFEFRSCGVAESLALLRPAFDMLAAAGIRTILTVSPVPLRVTFSQADCVVANDYSKAVLRVCAEEITREYAGVDYFPSYEIVRSGGISKFWDDNTHVRDDFVTLVVDYMVSSYARA